MITMLTTLAFALAASGVYVLYRRCDIGLICLLATETYYIALGPNAALIGGLHITPSDVIAIALLLAGILRTFRSIRLLNTDRVIVLCYLVLFVFSLVRGFAEYGLTATGNEARTFTGSLAGILYFATAPTDSESVRKYTLTYLWFGIVLCAVAVASAAGMHVGIMAWEGADLSAINGRFLPATGAEALAVCGFFSLAKLCCYRRSLIANILPILFFGFAIYMRHRTVWIVMLAGVAALLFLDTRLFRRIIPFAGLALVAVALIVAYNSTVQKIGDTEQFSDAVSNGQTFVWRVNGWQALLFDDEQNVMTVAAGKSIGSGYWRIDPITYQTIVFAPHSEYIQSYLRVGVIGTILMLLFVLRPLLRLSRMCRLKTDWVYPSPSIWAIVVLTTLVYGVTYGIAPHTFALLGIANAIKTGPYGASANEEEHDWNLSNPDETAGEAA